MRTSQRENKSFFDRNKILLINKNIQKNAIDKLFTNTHVSPKKPFSLSIDIDVHLFAFSKTMIVS